MKRNEQLRAGKQVGSQNRGQFLLVLMAFATGYMSSTIINMNQLERWLDTLSKTWWQSPAKEDVKASAEQLKQVAKQERVPKLEFYTVLTQEEKPLLPDTRVLAAAKSKPSEEQKPEVTLASEVKTEQKPVLELAKSLQKPPQEDVLPPASSKGNYVVQLASFRYSSQAQSFRDKLVAKGFNVKISAIRRGPMQWFRVMLGPYSSLAEAQKAQLVFQAKEHTSGMIRQMDA